MRHEEKIAFLKDHYFKELKQESPLNGPYRIVKQCFVVVEN